MSVRHQARLTPRRNTLSQPPSPPAAVLPQWRLKALDVADDDKVYEPDWEISDRDLESYVDIARSDN